MVKVLTVTMRSIKLPSSSANAVMVVRTTITAFAPTACGPCPKRLPAQRAVPDLCRKGFTQEGCRTRNRIFHALQVSPVTDTLASDHRTQRVE